MLGNSGIGSKIYFGFTTILLIMLGLSSYSYYRMQDLRNDAHDLKDTIGKQAQIVSDMELLVKEIQEDFTDAVVVGRVNISEEVKDNVTQFKVLSEAFNKVEEFIEVKHYVLNMQEKFKDYFKSGTSMLQAFQVSKDAGIKAMDEFDEKADKVLSLAQKLKNDHIEELNARYDNMAADTNNSVTVILIATIIAMFSGVVLSLFITRSITGILTSITKNLADTSEQTASAANQLSSAAQDLSSGANEQASSIEETSSSLEEMSGIIENNVVSAEESVSLSDKMKISSEQGNETMGKLQNSMKEILASNEKIEELVKVIGNIGEKTQVMDEIVFQTKLLSFNASVEAERAGEHGRGFAVVAQEVGNLAQMSGKAAQEIAEIVKDSIKNAETITNENKAKVEEGGNYALETAKILKDIVEAATTVSIGSNQVLSASKDQSSGIKQINSAMNQLDKATQANAATAEETASTSEELSAQTDAFNSVVNELSLLVYGEKKSRQQQRANINSQVRYTNKPHNNVVSIKEKKVEVYENDDTPIAKVSNSDNWERL